MMNFNQKLSDLVEQKWNTTIDHYDQKFAELDRQFQECNDIEALLTLEQQVEAAIKDIEGDIKNIKDDIRLNEAAYDRLTKRVEELHDKYFEE